MARTSTTPEINISGGSIDLGDFFGAANPWDDYTDTSEPIPAGTYDAHVKTVEGPMLNKKGDAHMLKVTYEIDGESHPEFANRNVWQYISLKPTAANIYTTTFAALGKPPRDLSYEPGEFDGMPCRLKLSVRPATEEYSASNNVQRVLPARAGSSSPTVW